MVLGIVSIPTCICFGLPPLICGPLAIVFYVVAKKQTPQRSGFYAVDHTGTIFVIDPQGMLHLKFPHDAPVDDLLPDVLHLLKSTTDAQGT